MTSNTGALLIGGLVIASLATWAFLLSRILSGKAVLEFEARSRPPWRGIAVFFSFVFLVVCQTLVVLIMGASAEEQTVEQTKNYLIWNAIATLGAMLASALAVYLVFRADWHDLGISLTRIPRDLLIGVAAFLILGPIAYFIQFIFVYALQLESHHPLIELLQQDQTNQLFGMVAFVVVIVAPLAEEYFFRVLLQGWLERWTLYGFGADDDWRKRDTLDRPSHPRATLDQVVQDDNPYASPKPQTVDSNHKSPRQLSQPRPGFIAAASPIVISAMVFALMHASNGPDPAALFFFALGLGYVYQRTHRLLPCVVTHFCLNATTLGMLWLGLDELAQ